MSSDSDHTLSSTGPGSADGPVLPAAAGSLPASEIDRGEVKDGAVEFINWKGDADKPSPPPPAPLPPNQRVGFAIAGLGRLALEEILPAMIQCHNARPVALISSSPEKARAVAAQYGIGPDAIYDYDSMHRLADNPDVHAVYVVTPNELHVDHVQAAARAGKHVLCEKPMANTADEARQMIDACKAAGVKLMIAYRCQFEVFNREASRLVQSGELGRPRIIEASNTQV